MEPTLLQEIEAIHPGIVQEVANARILKAEQDVTSAQQSLEMAQAVLQQRQAELTEVATPPAVAG